MILVAGATGSLGGEICRRLASQGQRVRALVRSTSNRMAVENLTQLGAELAEGDLKNPATLNQVCEGASVVISTVTTTVSRQPDDSIESVDLRGQINLIDAAKAAGVTHFIYISYSRNLDTDCALTTAKRTVEQHLQQSRLTYTILRPSYFMEVWLGPMLGFDYAGAKAQIYGTGHNPTSWISLYDVAQFAIVSLANPAARNAIIELGGPEPVSSLEVVQIFEEVGGRPFEVQHVPEEALREQLRTADDPLLQSFAALMLDLAQGDPIDMSGTLQTFPIEITRVRDYARRVVPV